MNYALIRPTRLDLESFAHTTSTHPDLVRRLVELGILDADQDLAGNLWFSPRQCAAMARIQRLRTGFALNYAALGLVVELLDHIAVLEATLQHSSRRTGGRPWT